MSVKGLLLFSAIMLTLLPLWAVAQDNHVITQSSSSSINSLWVMVCAALVFFMQLGFLAFEVGCIREKNTEVAALKNVGDWLITTVFYFLIGYGVMFGSSYLGFFGLDRFAGGGADQVRPDLSWGYFLFQLTFAGTAATIVSGAMAERTGLIAYLVFTMCMASIIYPVFGHWVWNADGWLKQLGFVDFGGGTVIHGIGAWASLVGVWLVGPRLGRYRSDGTLAPMEKNSPLWMCVGVFVMWFGWWGFNGGSMLEWNNTTIPIVIFNTNLIGATAGLMAFTHCAVFQNYRDVSYKTLGGILGGLAASSACCKYVTPASAIAIGAIAGVLHNYSYDLVVRKLKLDDVAGAIPIHGFCGTWGVLAIALFAEQDMFGKKNFLPHSDMLSQLVAQLIGVAACFVWTTLASLVIFGLVKICVGIRVPPMEEIRGLSFGDDEAEEREMNE